VSDERRAESGENERIIGKMKFLKPQSGDISVEMKFNTIIAPEYDYYYISSLTTGA
jgi:hypothetical protein